METDSREILSAFVDGERVDAVALASALAEPGAHEILVDFARLRAALADEPEPPAALVETMRRRLRPRPRAFALARSLRLTATAAVLLLALLGAIDLRRMMRPEGSEEPPPPTRVIRFEPGIDWGPGKGR
jgi:negative regulator of sigma E activity